jgi:hypothetical protein
VPRRGVDSSPGQELLGAFPSHGPFRESYRPTGKASGPWKETAAAAIAPRPKKALVSAERVPAALSRQTCPAALLQPRVPAGSAEVVGVEGPADLPDYGGWQAEAERTKPALPHAGQRAERTTEEGRSRGCEGHQ